MSGNVTIDKQQTAIFNALVPPEGPKSVSVALRFDLAASLEIDFTQAYLQKSFTVVQAVWIDNFNNADAVKLTVQGTGQTIEIPANSQGSFPVISAIRTKIVAASAGGVAVNAIFLNVPLPVVVWYFGGGSVVTVAGTVDVAGTVSVGNTVAVSGTLAASIAPGSTIAVLGTVELGAGAANIGTVEIGSGTANLGTVAVAAGGTITALEGTLPWLTDLDTPQGYVSRSDWFDIGSTTTGTAAVTLEAAAGSGSKWFVTDIEIYNGGTANTGVQFNNVGNTQVPAPASGGTVKSFVTPMQFAANGSITATALGSPGGTLAVGIQGYKGS